MARSGSVYIAIDADVQRFKDALKNTSVFAKAEGAKAGAAFHASVSAPLAKLQKDYATAFDSIKLSKIKLPIDSIKQFGKELNLTKGSYRELAERMVQNVAIKNAEKSFKSMAISLNLNQKEANGLAKELGFTENQTKKLITELKEMGGARSFVDKLKVTWTNAAANFYLLKNAIQVVGNVLNALSANFQNVVDIGRGADRAGIGVESFSKLSYAAKQTGVDINDFTSTWEDLRKSLSAALGGDKVKTEAFSKLNLDAQNLVKMNPENIFRNLVTALSDVHDQGEKIKLVEQIFGKGGKQLLPLLKEGGKDFDKFISEAERLGLVVKESDVEKAKRASEAITAMKASFGDLGQELAMKAAPTLEKIAATLTDIIRMGPKTFTDLNLEGQIFELNGLISAQEKILGNQENIKKVQLTDADGNVRRTVEVTTLYKIDDQMTEKQFKSLELNGWVTDVTKATEALKKLNEKRAELREKQKEPSITGDITASIDTDKLTSFMDSLNDKTISLKYNDEPLKLLEHEIEQLKAQAGALGIGSEPKVQDAIEDYRLLREGIIKVTEAEKAEAEEQKRWADAVSQSKSLTDFRSQLDEQIASFYRTGDAAAELDEKLKRFRITAEGLKMPALEIDRYEMQIVELDRAMREAADADFAKSLKDQIFALENEGNALAIHNRAMDEMREKYKEAGAEMQEDIDKLDKLQTDKIIKEIELSVKPEGVLEGLKSGVDGYLESLPTMGESVSDMVKNSMNGMTEAVAEFAASGKLDFKDFTDSVIKDLTRMAMQQAILKPILDGLGFGADTGHTGGIVGQLSGAKKEVSPLVFADAPRFHSGGILGGGLGAGEYPIIAKRGEGIFTPEQMRALSPSQPRVNVNVQNNAGAKVTVRQSYNGNGGVDIDARIESAMTAAAANRSSNFNQALGASRRLVRR
jgi:lambda family phage tail tape measure protein